MLTMPEHRFTADTEVQLAALVTEAAAQITHLIGGTEPRHSQGGRRGAGTPSPAAAPAPACT